MFIHQNKVVLFLCPLSMSPFYLSLSSSCLNPKALKETHWHNLDITRAIKNFIWPQSLSQEIIIPFYSLQREGAQLLSLVIWVTQCVANAWQMFIKCPECLVLSCLKITLLVEKDLSMLIEKMQKMRTSFWLSLLMNPHKSLKPAPVQSMGVLLLSLMGTDSSTKGAAASSLYW